MEKYSTGRQPEGYLYSKIVPEAKFDVSAKTQEGRSGSKTQSTGIEVSYYFKATKAAQVWSINKNFADLSQSKSVKGTAIEVYPAIIVTQAQELLQFGQRAKLKPITNGKNLLCLHFNPLMSKNIAKELN